MFLQTEAQWPVVFKMGMHACFRHQSKLSLLSSIPELYWSNKRN